MSSIISNGVLIDINSPIPSLNVRVGSNSIGALHKFYIGHREELSANWDSSIPSASPISFYEFSIGTLPGFSDILDYQNIGNTLSISNFESYIPSTLNQGVEYYLNIRCTSASGATSINSTSSPYFIIDYTAPEIGWVLDGDSVLKISNDEYLFHYF